MKIHIVMLSGGLDSTALLFKLLEETKEEEDTIVYGHYINFSYIYEENQFEAETVTHIVRYATMNYLNFKFSNSTFNFRPSAYKVSENITTAGFIQAMVALDLFHRYWGITGQMPFIKTYFSADATEWPEETKPQWTPRWETQKKVFKAVFHEFELANNLHAPELETPLENITRDKLVEIIPEELRKRIASCRRPQRVNDEWLPCGDCVKCDHDRRLGILC